MFWKYNNTSSPAFDAVLQKEVNISSKNTLSELKHLKTVPGHYFARVNGSGGYNPRM